jgi:predicted transposase YbfD/YdcC
VTAPAAGSLLALLAEVPDPRGRQGLRHVFVAMLATVVCAMLQGARGFSAIVQWIHSQDPSLWHELGYQRRPPKLGALRNLFLMIPPEQFEAAIRAWMTHCVGLPATTEALQAVAIDGKTLCGTFRPHQRAVHLVSAFDHATGCTLSQVRMNEQTNEAKAALELLRTLVVKGRVVTGDAMFCQREICKEVIDQQGHYLFVLKDNQPTLREAVAADFQAAFSPGERTETRCDSCHGQNAGKGARPRRAPSSGGLDAPGRPPGLAGPPAGLPVNPHDSSQGEENDRSRVCH